MVERRDQVLMTRLSARVQDVHLLQEVSFDERSLFSCVVCSSPATCEPRLRPTTIILRVLFGHGCRPSVPTGTGPTRRSCFAAPSGVDGFMASHGLGRDALQRFGRPCTLMSSSGLPTTRGCPASMARAASRSSQAQGGNRSLARLMLMPPGPSCRATGAARCCMTSRPGCSEAKALPFNSGPGPTAAGRPP